MKFAFLILGDFRPETDRAAIHGGAAQMRGVSTLEGACAAAQELLEQGVGCIEPVSYTHLTLPTTPYV